MVVGSMYWKTDRQKRKEFDAIVAERKAKEKNEAWIRELEARDVEDRELRAQRAERERRRNAGRAASMVDEREARRGTLEMVAELAYGRR